MISEENIKNLLQTKYPFIRIYDNGLVGFVVDGVYITHWVRFQAYVHDINTKMPVVYYSVHTDAFEISVMLYRIELGGGNYEFSYDPKTGNILRALYNLGLDSSETDSFFEMLFEYDITIHHPLGDNMRAKIDELYRKWIIGNIIK